MFLIVGVDPGTTTGVAAVSLNGVVKDVYSSRDLGVDGVIKRLNSIGRVSIVASDVNPAPDSVAKIASSLGCKLFIPHESLSVAEKNLITNAHNVEDLHSRDALAAALNACSRLKNKLAKLDALGCSEEVKHKVLQGIPIQRALEKPSESAAVKKTRQRPQQPVHLSLRNLEEQNRFLREQVALQDSEIARLKKQVKDLAGEKTDFKNQMFKKDEFRQQQIVIESLEFKIKLLQEKLVEAEKFNELWNDLSSGQIIPVGLYPQAPNGVTLVKHRITGEEAEKLTGLKLAFSDDSKTIENLAQHGIATAHSKELKEQQGLHYLSKQDYDRLLSNRLRNLEHILEDYRKERAKRQ
jgi:predicted RNase H-like nuclease (RuvC/YqgF family)